GFHPLTRSTFITTINKAMCAVGIEPLPGHGICIGATLEYLLHGVPFAVMRVKHHWASDTFTAYLRKHAQILVPYMQATPETHSPHQTYGGPSTNKIMN
ncbi:hypothetical protein SERLADRAFT_345203, partial [Serpula lacrymans var. lacrymans S7.9]